MREVMKKHVLICGERGVGKSTLVRKLLEEIKVPVSGFMTKSTEPDEKGFHAIYMYPALGPYTRHERDNRIGDCDTKQHLVNPDVFDGLGMELLKTPERGIIVMDELGFMETQAEHFCGRVLEILDGDIPVLATVKSRYDIDFLNEVRAKEKAQLFMIDKTNRDELFEAILPYVNEWNSQR